MEKDDATFCFFAEVRSREVGRILEESSRARESIAGRVHINRRTRDDRRRDARHGVSPENVSMEVADRTVHDYCITVGRLHEVEDGIGGVADRDEENLYIPTFSDSRDVDPRERECAPAIAA